MDDFALTLAERGLLRALNERGVRFLVVGLGAELIEGAPVNTHFEIDGVPLRVLPLERVIASKRATNRPKDRAALPSLEATLLARRSDRKDSSSGS